VLIPLLSPSPPLPPPPPPQNHGNELERARDLFYALWTPDLFMERVEKDGDWALFCPNEAPGLADVHGEEFNRLYEKCVLCVCVCVCGWMDAATIQRGDAWIRSID
jgi:hypothetical protein